MTSRADMKTEILGDTERGDAEGSLVLEAISAAIKFYQPKRFYFNESRDTTFNTTASTGAYTFATIGTTFYTIDGVFLTDSSTIYELERGDYRDAERAVLDTTARPSEYAYFGKSLYLTPIPDDAYSVRLTGHIKLDEPDTDAEDGNDWFEEAYDLIKSRAKAYLYAHVWENPGMAQMMAVAEAQALAALREATTTKTQPGYLVATEF